VCRHKAWLRGSNSSLNGQCGGCRAPATIRDSEGGNNKAYIGGYSENFMFELDPRIGPQPFRCGDMRLRLTHNQMFEQALDIEYRRKLVKIGVEDKVRFDEIKAAYGCRGLCEPIRIMPWLDYTTYFAYPICHNLLLGLHGQILGNIRDKVGAKIFENAVRASDKLMMFLRRPAENKRPTKRILPEKSSNLFSGFKIEDHLHGMETFEPLVFYGMFDDFGNGHQLKVLYFRFVSAAMFLLRGSTFTKCTGEGYEPNDIVLKEIIESRNQVILRQRRECIANIKSFCSLAQRYLNPSALSPNLHGLYCMIPYLMDMCGHPKFEICIERLVGSHFFFVAF
jgi:hypothetical protein